MRLPTFAQAIQMDRYGTPEVLKHSLVPLTPLREGEVRVRTLYAGVNYTDAQIRSGNWPITVPSPFPYTPGVEVVGLVEEIAAGVTRWQRGDRVVTMMQGLGGVRSERPGGYAEFVTVASAALAAIPQALPSHVMAALGLPAVTAYLGLLQLGSLRGRSLMVSGATGRVGSEAIPIALAMGATVTALIRRPDRAAALRAQGAVQVSVDNDELAECQVDAVLETVAGTHLARHIKALKPGGVLCLVGAAGGGDASLDAWDLIKPVILTGYSTERLDGNDLQGAVDQLAQWYEAGRIPVPDAITYPLARAAAAHLRLQLGGNDHRILLVPS
jgi:NADPH2:quinone reductase